MNTKIDLTDCIAVLAATRHPCRRRDIMKACPDLSPTAVDWRLRYLVRTGRLIHDGKLYRRPELRDIVTPALDARRSDEPCAICGAEFGTPPPGECDDRVVLDLTERDAWPSAVCARVVVLRGGIPAPREDNPCIVHAGRVVTEPGRRS